MNLFLWGGSFLSLFFADWTDNNTEDFKKRENSEKIFRNLIDWEFLWCKIGKLNFTL